MSNDGLVAEVSTTISAPIDTVWDALTNPDLIKQYMFGTEAVSEWKQGSDIRWKGTWEGKPYEDKGVILAMEAPHRLQVTHFSPLSGAPDVPENYHTLTYDLSEMGEKTHITLSQDKNGSEEEREQAQKMWGMMLESMKKIVEDTGN